MGVTQYIGSRYVPVFADPAEWNDTRAYEPLTIVLHEGNSFTSKQYVPVGIDITNGDYWAETGNYNSQVEQYRKEVLAFDGRITDNANDISLLDAQMAGTKDSALLNRIESLSTFVTPEMYNAKGDGVSDDYEALVSAFKSGKPVILGANKTYCFSKVINVSADGLNIYGNSSTLSYTGNETQATTIDACITFSNCTGLVLNSVNITANCKWIERPLYENSGTQWDAYTTERERALGALNMTNVNNFMLINTGITQSMFGMVISNCTDGRIIGGYSNKTLADVIAIRDATKYVYIYGFKAYFPQDDCFDAIGYGSATPQTATNFPEHIIYDSCSVDAGRGAAFCFEGGKYIQATNCVSTNMRFAPIKLGSYVQNSGEYGHPGSYQRIDNCQFHMLNPILSNSGLKEITLVWTCVNPDKVTDAYKAHDIQVNNCLFEVTNETTQYNTGGSFVIRDCDNVSVQNCEFRGRAVKITTATNVAFKNNYLDNTLLAQFISNGEITSNKLDGAGLSKATFLDVYYNLTNCTIANDSRIYDSTEPLFMYQATAILTNGDTCTGLKTNGASSLSGYTGVKFIGIPYINTSVTASTVESSIVRSIIDGKLYTNKTGSWVEL